ncbi:MAG TPA: hypothetical protein PK528_12460, partial [Syntrophorhabdus sp.]|nr:hypothetical protein [Syntrophorhabdus sp.]
NFIGIDIIPCFHPVKRQVLYIYDRKITLNNLKNNWVCEKGQKTTSIENYLYSKARECKIEFKFGEIFDLSQIRIEKTDEPKCIVATGLEKELYAELEIRQVVIKGCRGRQLK